MGEGGQRHGEGAGRGDLRRGCVVKGFCLNIALKSFELWFECDFSVENHFFLI